MDFEKIKQFLVDGKLKSFPKKKELRILALQYLGQNFEEGKIYSEKQVGEILDNFHSFDDKRLLRRELIINQILARKNDGSEYWKV